MPSHADLLAATPKCEACGRLMRCDHRGEQWWCASVLHPGRKVVRLWSTLVREQNEEA
jgi:hypothetical protein